MLSLTAPIKARLHALPALTGWAVRTNAEDASDTELLQDTHYLRTMWARIRQASQSQPAPSLLHQDLSLIQRVLRDMACENTHTIRIDSQEQHTALLAFAQSFMPGTVPKIQ